MDDVQKAIQVIKDGGIVIFPTDTAFGIGCRMDDEKAVARLFSLRKRPETKPTPVLVSSFKMAEQYLQPVSKEVLEKLVAPYWPGGLTIVLSCKRDLVPALVRGGTDTLGVRAPNHLTALSLIEGVGVPIVGTSANFSGQPTPYRFEDLDPELVSLVDYVVPGETFSKEASTVIDATQRPWKILRQGSVEVKSEKFMIVLFVDTANNKEVTVSLTIDGKEDLRREELDTRKAQVVLPMIQALMKDHGLQLKDLTEIKVNTGPGSFTGLRVGITIANTLGMLLQIPINGNKPGESVDADYDTIIT